MRKAQAKIILGRLVNRKQYLAPFTDKATHFEKLIAEAFSCILNLPFYSLDDDNTKRTYRVTWQGKSSSMTQAPPGPDTIAYCYNFHLLIEATRLKGAGQWKQEFSSAIRHCEDFCKQPDVQHEDVFVILVCDYPLHQDMYRSVRSVRSGPDRKYKLIPMETETVIRMLETSLLAFTMKHLEVRKLLPKILNAVKETSSLQDFKREVDVQLNVWQKDVLKHEKTAFTGIKSYEILITSKRKEVTLSEIFNALQKHPAVQKYFDVIGSNFLNPDLVENSLVPQGLASCVSYTIDDEPRLIAAPLPDFKNRYDRLVRELRKI
ncbi:hypothetical protein CEE36_10700 [candidate division TA06 bacterium B3_TA06]|uniref:Restriction endonuclease n=1 Tax=candidate division TA06 bacterium B3_TA06 TaxID=2012487 RepID=A0A532UU41_UNCT6|nr:MAG: hypothetical protein CEE36_10700 [candidate division TA06 bacterium B3_TA06]